jgi:ATP/maltotriose-dependent transcriptional regulator MalT/DNA-binding SARP family transcriptional activator
MTHRNQIILSQLTPPAQKTSILDRPRVLHLLQQSLDYPLTTLVTETGYGKTTSALSLIKSTRLPFFWYTISRNERDPRLFLTYLCSAFNQQGYKIGLPALRVLEDSDVDLQECLITLINSITSLLKENALFVMDDFQSLNESDEILGMMNWFIEHLPANLHLMILSRTQLEFPSINKWRVKGRLLEIDKDSLSFSVDETDQLYRSTYQLNLAKDDLTRLHQRTEGWAMGLQVVWQSIKALPNTHLENLLDEESGSSLGNLFDYLADEVLDMQSEEQQDFLIKTSVLQFLDSDTCDFLLDRQDSTETLNELYRSGLFIEQLKPDVFRYHHIFREFLLSRLSKNEELKKGLHRKLASYFSAHHYWEQAISHLISAGDFARLRQILDEVGDRLLQSGLKQSIRYWLGKLPQEEMSHYPYGNYLLGEVERTEANFDMALEYYRTAQRLYQNLGNAWGVSLALRGQAQVYLDTLRPVNAEQLLDRALELLDPVEYPLEASGLLTQIAENQVNQGATLEAEKSLQKARQLSPMYAEAQAYIEVRLLLRTGRLDEGLQLLGKLELGTTDQRMTRPQRFHREATLLLSLYYSLQGDCISARQYAQMGLQVSRQLQANYVEAVAKIRLGHALQLDLTQGLDAQGVLEIQKLYEFAIENVDIVRIHVEPLWGLCRLVGYAGNLKEAKRIADQALLIAGNAGDEWIGLMVRISLGAALALGGEFEAASNVLSVADSLAKKLNDNLASAAALLWEAYTADKQGYKGSALLFLEQGLELVQKHQYQFLLTRGTFLGPDDPFTFYPLVLRAHEMELQPELISQILSDHAISGGNYHPGYTLSLNLLGGFEARKGKHLIPAEQWKREKARQLLQALTVNSGKGMSKEQLAVLFWPEADETTAANNFKVTLSALNQTLEPDRPPKEAAQFVIRNGDQYQLNQQMRINLDTEQFEIFALSQRLEDKEQALALYKGRMLEGEQLQEAFMPEVQYYHRLYLDCLSKVIEAAIEGKDFDKGLKLSNRMVRQEPLLEVGYQYQMRIYHALGNLSMVRKVYNQAVDVGRKMYGVESDDLRTLFQELTG